MPQAEGQFERSEFRLILLRRGSRAIWTERNRGAERLPRVAIETGGRLAEQLQKVIEADLNMRVIVLDVLHCGHSALPCAVIEILSAGSGCRLTEISQDEISQMELSLEQREAIQGILGNGGLVRGPFSRMGWIEEAIDWLRMEVGRPLGCIERIRQFNASANFSLVRFGCEDGSGYWLKATGEPNTHEFEVTRRLVDLCAEHLPPFVAARRDWNAWLMEDAGQPIEQLGLRTLAGAVSSMAELQKRTVGQSAEFLTAGAFDQTIASLQVRLPKVMEYLRAVMEKQVSTKVPRLDRRNLDQLESALRASCARMEGLKIPETLVHNDVNLGNILFEGDRFVFTDWCEVGISNPFFGFEYLCLLQQDGRRSWRIELEEMYRQSWRDRLSSSQIDSAFVLSPPLAILSHLYGRGTWLHSPGRWEPRAESYARSLARLMYRTFQSSTLPEALCR